nr:AMP-binding protein [uncultured Methanobacterium sp.]
MRLREGFGQTECVVCIANFPWIEPRPGSMGKSAPEYDIQIMDKEGKQCDVGEEGEIVIKTANGKPPGLFLRILQGR